MGIPLGGAAAKVGKCTFGVKCNFAHGEAERRDKPDFRPRVVGLQGSEFIRYIVLAFLCIVVQGSLNLSLHTTWVLEGFRQHARLIKVVF